MFGFSNWVRERIERQIGVGFLVLVMMLAIFATISLLTVDHLVVTGREAEVAEEQARQVMGLEKNLASLERDVNGWVADPTEARFGAATGNLEDFDTYLTDLRHLTMSADESSKLRDISDLFESYRKEAGDLFVVAKADRAEAMRLLGGLSGLGSQIDNEIETLRNLTVTRAGESREALASAGHMALMFIIGFGLVMIVTALLLSRRLGNRLSGRILSITEAMKRLAEGDKAFMPPFLERADEVGSMARAVDIFRKNAIEADALAARHADSEQARRQLEVDQRRHEAEEAAARERAMQADAERSARLMEITNEFAKAVEISLSSVERASSQFGVNAETLEDNARRTVTDITSIAAASEQVSVSVTSVGGTLQQMQAAIASISDEMDKCQAMATSASDKAGEASDTMSGLTERARRIGNVVDLINSIAEQTNLLALNATIEAARAGEAGKGFAVVAAEVKQLANETSRATDEIGQEIEELQRVSTEAAENVGATGELLGRLRDVAIHVASAVEQHTAGSSEIATNMRSAAAGSSDVAARVMDIREVTDTTFGNAEDLKGASQSADKRLAELRRHVDGFLGNLRQLETTAMAEPLHLVA